MSGARNRWPRRSPQLKPVDRLDGVPTSAAATPDRALSDSARSDTPVITAAAASGPRSRLDRTLPPSVRPSGRRQLLAYYTTQAAQIK